MGSTGRTSPRRAVVGARTLTLLKHQNLLRLRLVDGDKAMLLLRLGTVAKVKARAEKARARLRTLLLVVLLLLLLVAMLLLLMVLEGELQVTISVLIVSRRVTTRIRPLIWPP